MNAKHLLLAAALVSLSLGGCRSGSDSGDEKESEEDTVNYRLKDVPDEDIFEEEVVEERAVAEEEVVGTPHVTEIKIVPEDKAKKEVKDAEQSRQREVVEVKEQAPVKENNDPLNISMVEQKPSFPGGDAAMYRWLGNNIMYPDAAAEEGVQGRVVVSFIIEKDGSISNVKVARGKHPALDAEAVRVARKMPRWQPGRNNGQPVRVTYNLPVTFKLQQ